MENKIKEWEKWLMQKIDQMENRGGEGGRKGETREKRYREEESNIDRLSEREVKMIKKWVMEKNKEERKCNIVIKGRDTIRSKKEGKKKVEKFIKEKLEVECKIMECRNSGPVIVAKVENEEKKKEIMEGKSKLIGENIYIENDLSWEERKKCVANKGKEERKCNIVIKGGDISWTKEDGKDKVERFIKEKLEVECKIVGCKENRRKGKGWK